MIALALRASPLARCGFEIRYFLRLLFALFFVRVSHIAEHRSDLPQLEFVSDPRIEATLTERAIYDRLLVQPYVNE